MKQIILVPSIVMLSACHAIPKQSPMPFIAPTTTAPKQADNPQPKTTPKSTTKQQSLASIFMLEEWFWWVLCSKLGKLF